MDPTVTPDPVQSSVMRGVLFTTYYSLFTIVERVKKGDPMSERFMSQCESIGEIGQTPEVQSH